MIWLLNVNERYYIFSVVSSLLNIFMLLSTTQQNCYFAKLKFSNDQIAAMRAMYFKYISSALKNYQYIGYGIPIIWSNDHVDGLPEVETFNGAYQKTDPIIGYKFNKMLFDPLWNLFDDLRPYMSRGGSLTIMPPFTVMIPHCDRPMRSCTIYFPISTGNQNCINDFYSLPKSIDSKKLNSTHEVQIPTVSYRMMNDAYIMNPHEWHGVRNYSRSTRIVLGWDFKVGSEQKTFKEIVEILKNLGYIKESN